MKTIRLKVSEFADVYSGGTPSTAISDYWNGEVAWITPKDMSHHTGIYIDRGERFITDRGLAESSACLLPADTVILSSRAPVGYVAVGATAFATNQGCKNLICKAGIAHPIFVYYLLKSNTSLLEANATGSTYKELSSSILKNITLRLPENMDVQRRIASILSAYDDLIENNRRRIALLERAARELYREWFVRLRFPGHEHTKIVDGVPEGWTTRALSEIADITMGQSPKSMYYNEDGGGLPFHQGVTNFGNRFPSHKTYCTVENRLAEPGDILFSVRAPVGRINITRDRIVIGRGLAAIRSNRGQQNLLFYALKSHFFREDMLGAGAIFAAITKKDLYGVDLLQAPDQVAEMFLDSVRPLDAQIERLHRMVECLTQSRDLLLPRLMSGEVAV